MTPIDRQLRIKELRIREKEVKLRARELAFRNWEAKFKAKTDVTESGIKGLTLINGGAAIALAAFLQAIISKPEAVAVVPYVVVGLGLNCLGVAAAASVFWLRYMQSRVENKHHKYTRDNPWWWASWGTCLLSIFLFVCGVGAVVVGGYTKLQLATPTPIRASSH